jgi:hypothetical protein
MRTGPCASTGPHATTRTVRRWVLLAVCPPGSPLFAPRFHWRQCRWCLGVAQTWQGDLDGAAAQCAELVAGQTQLKGKCQREGCPEMGRRASVGWNTGCSPTLTHKRTANGTPMYRRTE